MAPATGHHFGGDSSAHSRDQALDVAPHFQRHPASGGKIPNEINAAGKPDRRSLSNFGQAFLLDLSTKAGRI
jgi:hypothetical protein